LLAIIKVRIEKLAGMNTLAYFACMSIRGKKVNKIDPLKSMLSFSLMLLAKSISSLA